MTNPKWGTKRQCLECGARFYDLKKAKIACPTCDAPFIVEAPPKPKRAIATPAKAETPEATPKETTATAAPDPDAAPISEEEKAIKELEVEVPEDESGEGEDKAAFEDASELGEDEDDVNEVIDGNIGKDET